MYEPPAKRSAAELQPNRITTEAQRPRRQSTKYVFLRGLCALGGDSSLAPRAPRMSMCPAPIPMPLPRTSMKNSCQRDKNSRACDAELWRGLFPRKGAGSEGGSCATRRRKKCGEVFDGAPTYGQTVAFGPNSAICQNFSSCRKEFGQVEHLTTDTRLSYDCAMSAVIFTRSPRPGISILQPAFCPQEVSRTAPPASRIGYSVPRMPAPEFPIPMSRIPCPVCHVPFPVFRIPNPIFLIPHPQPLTPRKDFQCPSSSKP
jgi:hypothetical protein